MPSYKIILSAGMVAVLAAACGRRPTPEGFAPVAITTLACYDGQAVMSSSGRFIAYVSSQAGDRHIWLYDGDDTSRTPMTDNEGNDDSPAFSPDDERIVFSSQIDGNRDLWIIDRQDELTRLTQTDSADEYGPSWFPDGRWILFVRRSAGGRYAICKLNRQDVGQTQVVYQDSTEIDNPVYDPRTQSVYFQRKIAGRYGIWLLPAHELVPRAFTRPAWSCRHPSLSADGRWLAYVADTSGFFEVCLTGADEDRPVFITNDRKNHGHPSWSPDARRLLFEAASNWQIKIIDATTQQDTALVSSSHNDTAPVGTPDGRFVVFVSDRDGAGQLMVLDRRTGGVSRLLDHPGADDPDIAPDGRHLVFTSVAGPDIWMGELVTDTSGLTLVNAHPLMKDVLGTHGARYDHAGRQLVYVADQGGHADVWALDPGSMKRRHITVDERDEVTPSFSADDQRVLFTSNWAHRWSIWVAPLAGGIPLPVTRDKTPYAWDGDPQTSDDGSLMLFTRSWYDDADVWLLSMTGGEKTARTLTKDNTGQEMRGRWSPGGKCVLYQAGGNTDVWVVDVSALTR